MKLLVSVKEKLSFCLIVLAFQTSEGLTEVSHLKDVGAQTLTLKALTDQDIETLVCAKLGVSSISRDIADIVLSMSKGNPFFCTELTGSLVDQELLLYSNNSCSLVPDAGIKKPLTRNGQRSCTIVLTAGTRITIILKSRKVARTCFQKNDCNIIPSLMAVSVPYLNE